MTNLLDFLAAVVVAFVAAVIIGSSILAAGWPMAIVWIVGVLFVLSVNRLLDRFGP